jgi:hypothetical protein
LEQSPPSAALAETVNGKVMWANLHFLFWLSLFPFVTSWLNEAQPVPSPVPTALYGFVLLMAGAAWIPLMRTLIACNGGPKSELKKAIRSDWKEWGSVLVYAVAIALSFFVPIVSCGLYAAVAAMWFVPDRRIEEKVTNEYCRNCLCVCPETIGKVMSTSKRCYYEVLGVERERPKRTSRRRSAGSR